MNDAQTTTSSGLMRRSIGAVVAGILANVVLSMGTDAALHASGIYPRWFTPMADHLWALALAYRIVFAVVGGYLTARLAPTRPTRHVLVLLIIGSVLGLLGVLSGRNKGPEYGPFWFSLGIVIAGVPFTWLGGLLHARRIAHAAH